MKQVFVLVSYTAYLNPACGVVAQSAKPQTFEPLNPEPFFTSLCKALPILAD